MFSALSDKWQAYSQREKILLMVMGVLLFGLLAYYAIYKPLVSSYDAAQTRLEQSLAKAQTIASQAAILKNAADRPAISPWPDQLAALPLPEIIMAKAGDYAIPIQSQQSNSGNQITITTGAIKLSAFMPYLTELERHGIKNNDLTIRKNGDKLVMIVANFSR